MARKPKAEILDPVDMLSLIDEDAPEDTALVVVPDATPEVIIKRAASIVLLHPERFDQFYERVKARTEEFTPDLSSAKSRAEVASRAFEVTKVGTTLNKAGLALTEDWRARTKAVNDARMPMVERMKQLAAEVRRPLTEWEEAEDTRVAANDATLAEIRQAAIVTPEDTSETVAARGREVYLRTFDAPQWLEDEANEAELAKGHTVNTLLAAKARLVKEEQDRAELEELRREREARIERERQEGEARDLAPAAVECQQGFDAAADTVDTGIISRLLAEASLPASLLAVATAAVAPLWNDYRTARAERLAQEAREREEAAKREKEEDAQRERDAEAKRIKDREEAAEAARQEERDRAAKEQADRDAEHDRKLKEAQAETARIAKVAQDEQDERDRQAKEREREAQAQRDRDEAERVRVAKEEAEALRVENERKANAEHRREVIAEAVSDVCKAVPDVQIDAARAVVMAMAAGNVRHCAVSF
jgi:colicin import membrane protein